MDGERVRLASPGLRPGGTGWMVYWMQQAQRASWNHALEFSIRKSGELGVPLIVFFCLDPDYPGASRRHFAFMIEGLVETARELAGRGLTLVLSTGDPVDRFVSVCGGAAAAVTDGGHSPVQKRWRAEASSRCPCPFYIVETDTLAPPEQIYPRRAWSAAVLRRHIESVVEGALDPPARETVRFPGFVPDVESMDPREVLASMAPGEGSADNLLPEPGASAALERLSAFIGEKLGSYGAKARDPVANCVSGLSPYMHFGQISPLEVAWRVRRAGGPGAPAFLEQLLVRRELAVNYCAFSTSPGEWRSIPDWARSTLEEHSRDTREYIYSRDEFAGAGTHDAAWNAAQRELVLTGTMHGYMRMYWGKMILAWSASPREAFETAVHLNDSYALDGRDPNGYAGVAWCFGLHDRPWPERPVFGKVRSMTGRRLRERFDMGGYIGRIDALEKGGTG